MLILTISVFRHTFFLVLLGIKFLSETVLLDALIRFVSIAAFAYIGVLRVFSGGGGYACPVLVLVLNSQIVL